MADILNVEITDSAGCRVAGQFESGVKPCELPCDGDAIRAAAANIIRRADRASRPMKRASLSLRRRTI